MIVLYCYIVIVLSNEHALTLDPTSYTNLFFSLFLFTLLRLYLEIRDIWRPVAGLAGTRDSMAQIRDIPGNPGRVATLERREAQHCSSRSWTG